MSFPILAIEVPCGRHGVREWEERVAQGERREVDGGVPGRVPVPAGVSGGADTDAAAAKTQFIRMVVGGDRLWTMGFKRVNSFDGKRWEAHPDPNNG